MIDYKVVVRIVLIILFIIIVSSVYQNVQLRRASRQVDVDISSLENKIDALPEKISTEMANTIEELK